MPKKEPFNISMLMPLIPDDPTLDSMWVAGDSMFLRAYHTFPDNFIRQLERLAQDHGCTIRSLGENINGEELIKISLRGATAGD